MDSCILRTASCLRLAPGRMKYKKSSAQRTGSRARQQTRSSRLYSFDPIFTSSNSSDMAVDRRLSKSPQVLYDVSTPIQWVTTILSFIASMFAQSANLS
ncbi:hypothetical protein BDW72DRAFT_182795 [Aspergillus terricola var. indicus]